MLPELVAAAAKSIEGSRLTVLDGAQGVNDVATGMAAQGLSIYETLRSALVQHHNGSGDGSAAATSEEHSSA